MKDNNFKLCGGTLFSLLTTAKTDRKKSLGDTKGFSEKEFMTDLVKIYNPNSYLSSSMSKDTNNYKRCMVKDCASFSFSNKELIKQFDNEIKQNYSSKLMQMNKTLNYFLEIKNEPIVNKMVRGILELIKFDNTIDGNEKFYILPNGTPISKTALLLEDTFNLSSLILGVFHYIIVKEIDNTLGASTYEAWHTKPGDNKKHEFTSDIGTKYKPINLSTEIIDFEATDNIDTQETHQDNKQEQSEYTYNDENTNENNNTFIYAPKITQNAATIANGNNVINITINK